jgi:hypothetical protein
MIVVIGFSPTILLPGMLWFGIVILLLLFEKIKHLRNENIKTYERQ